MRTGQCDKRGILLSIYLERVEECERLFCLWRFERERVDKNDLAVFPFARKSDKQGLPAHAAAYRFGIILFRTRAGCPAAAAPDGRARRAVPCAPGALLPPGFASAAAHLAAVLGVRAA